MKPLKKLLVITLLLLCGVCIVPSTQCEAAKKMKITSYQRVSKKNSRVYFKKVKGAKRYKVEYYWIKSNGKNSKAKYKIVNSNKVKKNKKGYYITIPAKATIQYASISYNKKYSGGKWKKWSGYTVALCNHKYVRGKESTIHHDAEYKVEEVKVVVHHNAVYEEKPVKKVIHHEEVTEKKVYKGTLCNLCEEKLYQTDTQSLADVVQEHITLKHSNEREVTTLAIPPKVVVVVLQEAYDEVVTEYVTVLVKEAYDEVKTEYKTVLVKEAYDEVVRKDKCKTCGHIENVHVR